MAKMTISLQCPVFTHINTMVIHQKEIRDFRLILELEKAFKQKESRDQNTRNYCINNPAPLISTFDSWALMSLIFCC